MGWTGERVDVSFRDTLMLEIDDRWSRCSEYSSECNIHFAMSRRLTYITVVIRQTLTLLHLYS